MMQGLVALLQDEVGARVAGQDGSVQARKRRDTSVRSGQCLQVRWILATELLIELIFVESR